MRFYSGLLITLLLLDVLLNASFVFAGPEMEDKFFSGRQMGAAKWDLDYGYDEELDGAEKKEAERQKAEEDERIRKEKESKEDDFFGERIDPWDRTTFEKDKK